MRAFALLCVAILALAAAGVHANMYDGEMIQPSFLEVGESLSSHLYSDSALDAEAEAEAERMLDAIESDVELLEKESNAEMESIESELEQEFGLLESASDSESETEVSGTVDATQETEAHVEVDLDAAALAQGAAEVQSTAEVEAVSEIDAQAELEEAQELAAEAELEYDAALVEEAPTYVLPYAPVLPGHYSPLFNPYTNVNPLSTPFANIAAQPGAHPGVAAAAAAQAGALASVNGQIAGSQGGYPYYPYAARDAVVAQNLIGNAVPFSGYAGWVHPQNLNSASVGENAEPDFPQFMEVATSAEADSEDCKGCSFA